MGKKLTAQEAYERNMLTRIFPKDTLKEKVGKIVQELADLPHQSVVKTKELVRSTMIDLLEETNARECELLRERWLSEECMQAILKFMERRQK